MESLATSTRKLEWQAKQAVRSIYGLLYILFSYFGSPNAFPLQLHQIPRQKKKGKTTDNDNLLSYERSRHDFMYIILLFILCCTASAFVNTPIVLKSSVLFMFLQPFQFVVGQRSLLCYSLLN